MLWLLRFVITQPNIPEEQVAYRQCTRPSPLPRRRGSARLGLCVCVCVSVKQHLTYGASVRPENAVTYSAGNEGQNFVGFSLKPLRCRDPALPPLYGHAYSRPFFSCTRMRISRVYTRMIHRRGFSTLVLFIDLLWWNC